MVLDTTESTLTHYQTQENIDQMNILSQTKTQKIRTHLWIGPSCHPISSNCHNCWASKKFSRHESSFKGDCWMILLQRLLWSQRGRSVLTHLWAFGIETSSSPVNQEGGKTNQLAPCLIHLNFSMCNNPSHPSQPPITNITKQYANGKLMLACSDSVSK